MAEREVEKWITVNGKHIPVFKGESQQDAYNRSVAKMNEDKKKADIERYKKESDKLNGKSTSSKPWSKWKVGDWVVYTAPKDFDTVGTPKPQIGEVSSVEDDHAIVMVDGMKMWVDEDTIDQFSTSIDGADKSKGTNASSSKSSAKKGVYNVTYFDTNTNKSKTVIVYADQDTKDIEKWLKTHAAARDVKISEKKDNDFGAHIFRL